MHKGDSHSDLPSYFLPPATIDADLLNSYNMTGSAIFHEVRS